MRVNEITSIESEAGILASLIFEPDLYYTCEELRPSHFFDRENRTIYMALENLITQGSTKFDAYMIRQAINELRSNGIDAVEIPPEEIAEFLDKAQYIAQTTSENYMKLVDIVGDCSFRRDMSKKLDFCKSLCFDQKVDNIRSRIPEEIDEVVMDYDNFANSDEVFADKVSSIWEKIRERQRNKQTGIEFKNIPLLNNYCTLDAEELIVIAAYKKTGKSTFLTDLAIQAMEDGFKMLFIDSEMSDDSFLIRLLSYRTRIPYRRIRKGYLSKEEFELVVREKEWIENHSGNFIHENMPVLKPDKISALVKKWHHKIGLDVFVVDYIKTDGKQSDAFANSQMIGNVVDMCKNSLATKLKIAGIVAAQAKENGQLADSEKIERYASTVLLMTNKTRREMEMDGPECGQKKLRVKFNRNGESHMDDEFIDLYHDGNGCLIRQADCQHDPENYRDMPF